MPVSRSLGYLLGAGKEELSLALAIEFLKVQLGVDASQIEDRDENFLVGDLRCTPAGSTVEVKGQPIDPKKYPKNFIEVFEDTSRQRPPHHASGFDDVAMHLRLTRTELAVVPVVRFDIPGRPTQKLGELTHVSVSITSIASAAATIYVNNTSKMLYFYSSDALLSMIRDSVRNEGLRRGQGGSNRDTHAVLVPVSELRWQGGQGAWAFVGAGNPTAARERALQILAAG